MKVEIAYPNGAPGIKVNVEGATEKATALLRKEVGLYVRKVMATWPVDTAASLSGFRFEVNGETVTVSNTQGYAIHVHRKGETVPVWNEVRAAVQQAVSDLINSGKLAQAIAKGAKR